VTTPLLLCVDPLLSGSGLALGSVEAHGPVLVLVGAWGSLFELLSGVRRLRGGRLEIAGTSAENAAAHGSVGLVARDAPLPPTWTARDVLTASAELLGASRRSARSRARQALERLGLAELDDQRVSRLRPGELRALGIAMATLGEPPALALEQPFTGLEPSEQQRLAEVLERALPGRALLVSVPELPGSACEDALAAVSSELLFVSDQRLVARGSYRELFSRAKSYRVVVQRSVDALASRLTEAGYEVRRMSTADLAALRVTDERQLGSVPLFRAALEADAPIIELVTEGAPTQGQRAGATTEEAPAQTSAELAPVRFQRSLI
jgi:ABC-2 type transport system ATP-binding protein